MDMNSSAAAGDRAAASIAAARGIAEAGKASGRYVVECRDRDGNLKWTEEFENQVTTVGVNELLDKGFAGSSYTAAWYMGLVNSSPTYAAGDTMSSHSGWTENTAYASSTRPAVSWNAASSGSKASTSTSFSINADSQTIAGVFLVNNSTKSGTSGVLYSGGSFASNRSVNNGDTLNVTWTGTLTPS